MSASRPTPPQPGQLPISAFIICFNEAALIENCLRSLSMCAEIVVVDNGSTDGTPEVVQRLADEGVPVRFIHEPWRGFGGQKQFALEQCTQPWCFGIDADERVSPRLATALPDMIARDDIGAWVIPRFEYLLGYGYEPPNRASYETVRLVRRGTARYEPERMIHESLLTDQPRARAPEGGLMHFKVQDLEAMMDKGNQYTTLKARQREAEGRRPQPAKILFGGFIAFLRIYFGKGMWRYGWAGYVLARRGAFLAFLVEAKRWENEAIARLPVSEGAPDPRY